MQTTRRGFLGVMTAFTALAATGRAMPASTSSRPPLPVQTDMLAILKDCRVISYEPEFSLTGPETLRVTYRHAPKAPRSALDLLVEEMRGKRLPVSVSVTTSAAPPIEFWEADGSKIAFEVEKPTYMVEVVFL